MKFLRKVASLVLIAALLGGGYLWWNGGGGLLLNRLFHPAAGEEYGWNLILVNQEHYIPLDYETELTQLSNGQQVSSRIYPSLQQMFDDARAQGLALFVREGYRTQQEQTQLLEEYIDWLEETQPAKTGVAAHHAAAPVFCRAFGEF